MKVNQNGIALIKHFESLHDGDLKTLGLQPKMDPVGIWTVGYGHALWNAHGQRWYKGEADKATVYLVYGSMTEQQAEALLLTDLLEYENTVLKMIKRRDLDDNQFSALVSFCYNCGTHFKNNMGIKKPFKIWELVDSKVGGTEMYNYWKDSVVKSGGRVLPGLVRRRKSEATLYTTGMLDFMEHTA